jgi:hypothetical protein
MMAKVRLLEGVAVRFKVFSTMASASCWEHARGAILILLPWSNRKTSTATAQ